MLSNFQHLVPEKIFTAAERLGGRCTGRFLALNAMENRVYQIEMEDGGWVVIKFYRPGRWDRNTIQSEHLFLKSLEENEIPVVRPLANSVGETLLETDEGIFFAIFPRRPGRLEAELNKEQLTRLGRFLARLHNVGASMKSAPRTKLTPTTYGRDTLSFLKEQNLIPELFRQRYEILITQICDASDPMFEGVESVLLHGDCHAGNILWRGDEPYFIDFDDMLYAPPVQDIWMLTGSDDSYGKTMRELLLEEYETIRQFDHSTLRLIEALRVLRMIHFTAWIAKRWEDGAFKLAFPHFGSERYWQEQLEGLAIQLEKITWRQAEYA